MACKNCDCRTFPPSVAADSTLFTWSKTGGCGLFYISSSPALGRDFLSRGGRMENFEVVYRARRRLAASRTGAREGFIPAREASRPDDLSARSSRDSFT